MTKPTRDEVESWKYESAHSPLHDHAFENHNRLICLADAYLAQEEELKDMERKCKQLCCRVGVLEMEKQKLQG